MSYAEFMEKGLEENRYLHFKKLGYEDSDIESVINDWELEKVNKGYDVINFDGTGMLQIEAIGDVDAFESKLFLFMNFQIILIENILDGLIL